MNRRGFLKGLGLLIVAPAVIRTPGLLMPIRDYKKYIRPMPKDFMIGNISQYTDFDADAIIRKLIYRDRKNGILYGLGYKAPRSGNLLSLHGDTTTDQMDERLRLAMWQSIENRRIDDFV